MSNIPANLKYSKSHEWILEEDGVFTIGLTDYAQSALGDIVFINLPEEGDSVTAGESFSDVESVKAVSDVFSPVTGTVTAVNEALLELMALDFAIDELGLYLTTHPEDTEVLNLYWSYIKLGREGREAYEKQYGPILQTDVTPGSFKWLNDPWPWDLEGEK